MKLLKTLLIAVPITCALAAHADTRLIEGKGSAKNAAGITAEFDLRVGQINDQPAQGRFAMGWRNGDKSVLVTSTSPKWVGVVEKKGRFHGPGKVTVKIGATERSWEGTIYFSAADNKPGSDHPDVVRLRFIKNVWDSPEGDFFFEAPVVTGDIVVKKT